MTDPFLAMKVTVGDLRIGEAERKAVIEVLDGGRISEGRKVAEFEKKWAAYIGTKYAVAVNSGTSALICGLLALANHPSLEVKLKTKIITTPLTYISTSNAIILSGFEPVYVDTDPNTFGITAENIRTCLEEAEDPAQYSVILPVHLMGYPCDMNAINRIAKDYGLTVFEDSAQAHGTLYKGRRTGSLSRLSDYSFYIAHNIQAGELGALVSDDYDIVRIARKIKANGRTCDCPVCTRNTTGCPKMKSYGGMKDNDPRFTHDFVGYNFKTMEFPAALALSQLDKTEWIMRKRQENVRYLNDGLERYSDVLQLPHYDENVSYLAYPLVIKDRRISRRKLRCGLEKAGVETRPLFGCIPTQQPAYAHLKEKYDGKLPNAEYVGKNGFYIGCHQYLTTQDLDYVIDAFKGCLK